jgi:hypothetical protein
VRGERRSFAFTTTSQGHSLADPEASGVLGHALAEHLGTGQAAAVKPELTNPVAVECVRRVEILSASGALAAITA